MSSNTRHNALRRLALALAAAGLLLAASRSPTASGGIGAGRRDGRRPDLRSAARHRRRVGVRPGRGTAMKMPAAWLARRRGQDRDRAVPAAADAGRRRRRAALPRSRHARLPDHDEERRTRRPTSTRACGSSFAFNHAEAQRAFQAAQKLDPDCAACYWGEALILGPEHQRADDAGSERARARRAREGGGAEGRAGAKRTRADRGARRSATRPIPRPSARRSIQPTPTR